MSDFVSNRFMSMSFTIVFDELLRPMSLLTRLVHEQKPMLLSLELRMSPPTWSEGWSLGDIPRANRLEGKGRTWRPYEAMSVTVETRHQIGPVER